MHDAACECLHRDLHFRRAGDEEKHVYIPPDPAARGDRGSASVGEDVLVYVTSPSAELAGLLRNIRGRFVCYGFQRDGQDGNLTFKKPSLDGFLADLVKCRAVIANAGFSL